MNRRLSFIQSLVFAQLRHLLLHIRSSPQANIVR